MDPCPYVRILVGNLSLKFPKTSRPIPSSSAIHPSTSPCYCKIKLNDFPNHKSAVALSGDETASSELTIPSVSTNTLAACFTLSKAQVESATGRGKKKSKCIVIEVYVGGGATGCGWQGTKGKLLGKVRVPFYAEDLKRLLEPSALSRGSWFYMHNGWAGIGASSAAQLYLSVRAEADPRYVFQFGGEPECSPQVFQVQGSVKQAVFTCKFSLRNPGDRALGSWPSVSEQSASRSWLSSFGADKDQPTKERKGWTITIHDLSGSPVAMASMVTPFVPSPGSDRVSRSSPGAWLILRPSYGTWKPWGRLEAWREPRNTNVLGYSFELLNDSVTSPITAAAATTTLASSSISTKQGGKFTIDTTNSVTTPINSPHGSFDLRSGSGSWCGSWSGSEYLWSQFMYKGFVMSSTVEGSGKCSKPEVEVGVQHVNCTEDAAAFVALAAALDLSMDACKLFSHKLRKELRY